MAKLMEASDLKILISSCTVPGEMESSLRLSENAG